MLVGFLSFGLGVFMGVYTLTGNMGAGFYFGLAGFVFLVSLELMRTEDE